jgi:UDP-N-acetylglucosamine 2-epimerase
MRNYQRIWQQYRSAGKPVIVLEVGGLRRNESFKIGINGVNAKADFANETFDDKRWPLFRHTLQPWKDTGNKIIILGQHHTSEQWAGMPSMDKWFENQIQEIRKHTDRAIEIRPHPRNPIGLNVKKYSNVSIKYPIMDKATIDDTDFKKTLNDAWAVVNYSSNPAMEAVINGVPVFVSEDSLCHEVGNTSFENINNPTKPDRQNWAYKLSYTEWFANEIAEGKPWRRIKKRLEEKYFK